MAVLLGGSVLVAQAATARHEKVNITVWTGLSGPDQTGMIAIVDAFNAKKGTGVHVNYSTKGFTDYYGTLTTTLAHNTDTPQLWSAPAANLSYLSQQAPFDKLIQGSKVLNRSKFPHTLWDYYQWKGKQYSIPLYAVPFMEYYNKAILKHPVLHPSGKKGLASVNGCNCGPIDVSLLNEAKHLTKNPSACFSGSGLCGLVLPETWPNPFLWPTLVGQFGGSLYNAKTKTCLEASPAAQNALLYLYDVIYKWHLSPKSYQTDQDLKMLPNGTAAQIVDGIWEYTNPALQTLGKNEGVSNVPQYGPHYKVFVGDLGWSINKKNSPAVNKAIIKFLSFYEQNSAQMAKVGDVPVYLPVLHEKGFAKKYPAAGAAYKELNPSVAVYSPKAVGLNDGPVYADAINPVSAGQIKGGSQAKIKSEIKAALTKGNNVCTQGVRHPSG
jgi:multiple sugar transport system substrate-binding protein